MASVITFTKEEVTRPQKSRRTKSGFSSNLSSLLRQQKQQNHNQQSQEAKTISTNHRAQNFELTPSNSLVSSHSFSERKGPIKPLPTDLPFKCTVHVPLDDEMKLGKVVVHIGNPQSIIHLRKKVLSQCYSLSDEEKLGQAMVISQLFAATEEGARDPDVPVLSHFLPVHELGLSDFVLDFVSGTTISSITPTQVSTQVVFLGPRPKPIINPIGRFFQAAETGDIRQVRMLHQNAKVDLNGKGIDNWQGLHFAARKGHVNVIAYLLRQSADVNCVTKNGWTPLHLACCRGHLDVVETLLACDAEINSLTKRGKTPLYFAITEGKNQDVIDYMRENGGNEDGSSEKQSG